jgi:hypothetical protein
VLGTVVLVAGAACSGPRRPLELGVQEVGSDIVLGSRPATTVVPAPVPPVTLVAALPALAPSFGPSTTTTTVPAPACPAADPFAAPRLVAPTTVTQPPVAATYQYRNDGSFSVRGPDGREGHFPATSSRIVGPPHTDATGAFTFTVHVEVLGTSTDTVYHVLPLASATQAAGLYVQSVTSTPAGGMASVFAPVPEMELLPFPAVPGTTFSVTAVDPRAAVTMRYSGAVAQKSRVDACGIPVDAVTVNLTDGSVLSPNSNETFTATYAIATQYGGLAVADTVKVAGTEGSDTVSRENRATINEVPKEPRA